MVKKDIDLVKFETSNGNSYIYNNELNIVIPLYDENEDDIRKLKPVDVFEKYKNTSISFENNKEIDVEKFINNNGISQMILVVTESCNFRCKYCAYSGHYELNRTHSGNHMTEEIARKAIDLYVDNVKNAMPSNPNISPVIGFYGGEPLIQWDLIKNSVNYIKENYKDFYDISTFTISTNGYLLNEENINFMIDNKFHICISLDGPKYEHDRNRVTTNEELTFDRVTENIKLVNKIYSKKSIKNKEILPYAILVTYDLFSDISKIEEFFKENNYLDKFVGRISGVNDTNTTYYNNLNESDIKCKESMLRKNYIEQLNANNTSTFMDMYYSSIMSNYLNIRPNNYDALMGTCVPGQKMAVDYKGDFHMCERICDKYSIGNVYNGFDKRRQQYYLNRILEVRKTKCKGCNFINLCKLCFAQIETEDGDFKISEEFCNKAKENILNGLSLTYSMLEDFPNEYILSK